MRNSKSVLRKIASAFNARQTSGKRGNAEWVQIHGDTIESLCKEFLPSGSGFDNGTSFNFEKSRENKLVFDTAYHHMEEGMYDGWTEHQVTVTPDFVSGFDIHISGPDRNSILDYIADTFSVALDTPVPEDAIKSARN